MYRGDVYALDREHEQLAAGRQECLDGMDDHAAGSKDYEMWRKGLVVADRRIFLNRNSRSRLLGFLTEEQNDRIGKPTDCDILLPTTTP